MLIFKLKIKKFLLSFLLGTIEASPLIGAITRWPLRSVGRAALPVKPIGRAAKPTHPALSSRSEYESVAPRVAGEKNRVAGGVFPAVMAHRLSNAIVHSSSSAIICGENIVLSDYYYENRQRVICTGGNFKAINNNFGIIDARTTESLSSGIAIFGSGSFNYYHWLIEILPTAFLSQRLAADFQYFPLLVPEQYEKHLSYKDSLDIFRAGRTIVTLRSDRQYQVDDLLVIDSPVHGPFNLRSGMWPRITDYRHSTPVLTAFRQTILDAAGVSGLPPERKLFLARGGDRRSYNQNELAEISKNYGFEVVFPEELSFLEQVRLFQSARIIVGASGAAWANMLFCSRGSKGLTWVFPEYDEFCAYSNIARTVGLDLEYLFPTADRIPASTDEAYGATYRLEPESFRIALERLEMA